MVSKAWRQLSLGEAAILQRGYDLPHRERKHGNIPIISSSGFIDTHNESRVAGPGVVTGRYGTIGEVFFTSADFWPLNTTLFVKDFKGNDPLFISFLLRTIDYQSYSGKSGVPGVNRNDLHEINVNLPPLPEQQAIATALSGIDALITSLNKLIAKKRDIKQATMQCLLTGSMRLPGVTGEWEVKKLEEITICLDNLRVPLNDEQRLKIKGDYPYCGANGVLDYVNGYIIDDDIILIAEDGGYFDEYTYRPIAYRMTGKCWVNNHAHILKTREHIDQNFVYYSLVHKNILSFLASGTRAKLNKSEMYKIEINMPKSKAEQQAIATILSDMDAEIVALEQKRDKTRALKQGMMQELLTGKTRLV